jgi:hypothetical protein
VCKLFVEIVLTTCTGIIQSVAMTTDKSEVTVDVRAFIQHFGGPAAMRAAWYRTGLTLTTGAQDKWVMRGVIPTSRILEAVQVAKAMRQPFDFNKFLITKKGKQP